MSLNTEILIYQTPGGATKIDVRVDNETVWLSLNQLAELFQRDKSVISRHIKNIFSESELEEAAVVANFATTAADGKTYQVDYYNLDMIISVGYRVQSQVATQFRRWATARLREFLVKGFVLDDERLKQARNDYFDELLARIRDIRSSEKVFYKKVCDIYATSIDYEAASDLSREFFATVQNKFHYAIHGHTAAELIQERADASKPMGLTNWPGPRIKATDTAVAKNYLEPDELDQLNRIVNQYLEFAELQAMQRKPMHMKDWMTKLHGFLTLNDRDILTHAGKVSHEKAELHARKQYAEFIAAQASNPDELDKAIARLGKERRKQ